MVEAQSLCKYRTLMIESSTSDMPLGCWGSRRIPSTTSAWGGLPPRR